MDTLAQIQNKLKNVMLTSNIESPELDALGLLLSNAIYINQANVTSAAIEMSPSKCIQLNSAITHARDKGYSVYRGRNPHFRIKNAYVTKLHDMSKYATFAETNNYKLVLANDYTNNNILSGQNLVLEVILTKDVLTESFTAEDLYSYQLSGVGISEDISLFKSNGSSTDNWSEVELVRSIEDVGEINLLNDNAKVAVITDTDYSATLYNVTKFKSDYAYICKYLPLIINDVGDTKDIMTKFKSFNGFALNKSVRSDKIELEYESLSESGDTWMDKDGKVVTTNYVSPRESDKDNIYLNSIYSFNSTHKISTEKDIEYAFKSYSNFSQRFIGIKCVMNKDSINDKVTIANLYYAVNKLDSTSSYEDLSPKEKSNFISSITRSYYLDKDTLKFDVNNLHVVEEGSMSIVDGSFTYINGHIIVHANKNVISEVVSVANNYIKSNYNMGDGSYFYPTQWLALMQKVDGVNYIEFDSNSSYSNLSIVLSNKHYKTNSNCIGKYIKDYIINNDNSIDNGGFHISLSET